MAIIYIYSYTYRDTDIYIYGIWQLVLIQSGLQKWFWRLLSINTLSLVH